SRIRHVLGVDVADADVPGRLQPLGFAVEQRAGASGVQSAIAWSVTVPSFRVDVQREIDLIEEIARHDGYKGRPATVPAVPRPHAPPDPRSVRDQLFRQLLTACGMSEAVTFSFIEAAAAGAFADAGHAGAEPAGRGSGGGHGSGAGGVVAV